MDKFFASTEVKALTFFVAAALFFLVPFVNSAINKRLPLDIKAQHAKLAKDAWIKTILLFAAAMAACLVSFVNGGFEKAVSQAFFSMCLFTSFGSFWTIAKTKTLIKEAKELSVAGNRENSIQDIESINREKAVKTTLVSFAIGLAGFLYVAILYSKFNYSWVWFVGFLSTSFAIQSARWSDAANVAIAKYASNPNHGA